MGKFVLDLLTPPALHTPWDVPADRYASLHYLVHISSFNLNRAPTQCWEWEDKGGTKRDSTVAVASWNSTFQVVANSYLLNLSLF